ncbi:MAG TPA: DUF3619 family protein [Burkholderiales bacterium]|nr:DUF3619 family protein [Burkholderiales bacterium]
MNEKDVAGGIVARLDQNLAELPPSTVQKLQAARQEALAAYRADKAWSRSRGNVLTGWIFGRSLTTRLVLPAAIVLASLTGLIYWQVSSHHDDELDTGLLAGELPLHAYTDPGFETWLKHSSYTPSRQ